MNNSSAFDLSSSKSISSEWLIIAAILSVVILFSVFGNLLICAAILTERNLRKSSNFFYVSLAVADLLVALVVMTFALANDVMGHWIFGSVFCDIWQSADVMCSTASILNLCAISADRFLHVRKPYKYETSMTSRRTLGVIALLWMLSGLMSFVPIHLDLHKLGVEHAQSEGEFTCVLQLNPAYALTSSFISFFLPCVIMITLYFKLYTYAQRHLRNIKRATTWGSLTPDTTNARAKSLRNSRDKSSDQLTAQNMMPKITDNKAAITLGVIMGTFLLCWTPFFVVNVTGAFCNCIPPRLFNVLTWLGYFNSMVNPIIYPIFNKDFRKAFKRILGMRMRSCCCIVGRRDSLTPTPSETHRRNIIKISKTELNRKPSHSAELSSETPSLMATRKCESHRNLADVTSVELLTSLIPHGEKDTRQMGREVTVDRISVV